MDRESAITHLQIIHTWAEFARERDLQFFTVKHLEDIAQWADDALNLLKEQEPITANKIGSGWFCGGCNKFLTSNDDKRIKFCWSCGKPVLWEERNAEMH